MLFKRCFLNKMKERNDINLNIKKTLEKNPNKKTLILKNNLEKINLEKKKEKNKSQALLSLSS